MVILLIGIISAAAMVRMHPEVISNLGARVDARRMMFDLQQARRRAIALGDDHRIQYHRLCHGT